MSSCLGRVGRVTTPGQTFNMGKAAHNCPDSAPLKLNIGITLSEILTDVISKYLIDIVYISSSSISDKVVAL